MQILLSLSIAMFAGLMLSRLAKLVKLPAVTAYLVAGILVGPYLLGAVGVSGLGFTSMAEVKSFSLLSNIALGFIAFSIGNEFRLAQLKKTGKQATVIGIIQAVFTTLLVDAILIGLHFLMPDKQGGKY
ncbi:MAG: sodium:proton antiporter, partial [Ruminococcaceae bacterium]|nr:sodium:proton antiporter [Oscillospiraceae bacterium]